MLVDSHTHLQFPQYNKDRDEIIRKTRESGVAVINVGTDKAMSKAAAKLAEKYEHFYATVGLHPTDEEVFDYDFYKQLAGHQKVVAIGECGIDYYRTKPENLEREKERQEKIFRQQIELAKEVGKPLMIHARPQHGDDAYEDIYKILKPEMGNLVGAVLHFFVGSPEMTKRFVDLGCYFTFGGVITFARDYDKSIDLILLDKILLETDAPFVAPTPHRGKRNEPSYVIEVYKKMAELKNLPLTDLQQSVLKNNRRIFGIELP